jgi:hypothetical protein
MFCNWLQHASKYLDQNTEEVVVAPLDQWIGPALEKMKDKLPFPFTIRRVPSTPAYPDRRLADWGTKNFAVFEETVPHHIWGYLDAGCTVLYVEIDTVWVRPVFPAIDEAGAADLYMVNDNGVEMCSCFLYVNPTDSNKALMSSWASLIQVQPGMTNQKPLNIALSQSQSNYTVLKKQEFPNGTFVGTVQCDEEVPKHELDDYPQVRILHANGMLGLVNKVSFLSSWGTWSMSPAAPTTPTTPTVAVTPAPTCSMFPGKRVVLVTVSAAYYDMFRNWLHYASRYLDKSTEQLVVTPLDQWIGAALEKMKNETELPFPFEVGIRPGQPTDVRRMANYGSGNFAFFMAKRPSQILEWLDAGCTTFFVDIDTVWMRPVFPALQAAGAYDLYLSHNAGGVCGCFLYANPTPANKYLMRRWTSLLQPGKGNEPPLNRAVGSTHLNATVLSTPEFPSGKVAQAFKCKGTVRILHANYRVGLGAKIQFLASWGKWNTSAGA